MLINFIVITKGATRVAEVSARFTLDAMPGKQMSIDADLNSGLISENDARLRRREIENEANFYGAMDGASKFVRGDAIAGVIIVLVNIVGGLIVGVLQQGMPMVDAAKNYTLLTIGDGLVTQVPALIVSTAAGMLVTRSAASADLGEEMRQQIFTNPKAMGMASLVLFTFAVIPGMPKLSFMIISILVGAITYKLYKATEPAAVEEKEAEPAPAADSTEILTPLDPLGLEVGYGLISLVDVNQGGELLQRIKALRRQIALEMGFIVPAIHIRDNLQLKPNDYAILIKGIEIVRGELMPGHHLAITSEERGVKIPGIETREPAFNLPAVWIPDRDKEGVQAKGFVVVDPATVVTTHLTEIIKSNIDGLLGRREVQALLDNLAVSYPKVVEEMVPKLVNMGTLQKVLQKLLRERVSIRDLLTIIETLADYISMTKNVDILTGYVRQGLARAITRQYQDQEGNISVIMVSPELEDIVSQSVQHMEYESFISPDPNMVKQLIQNMQRFVSNFVSRGLQPVVLCSPNIRIHLRKVLEQFLPNVVVLAHNEITHDVKITYLGMVEL